MQEIDKIILAWKDEDYRDSLSAQEQGALPANPAGLCYHQEVASNRYPMAASYRITVSVGTMCVIILL